MRLPSVFRASIFGSVAFAALMLGQAEGTGFPALLTLPLAAFAFLLAERTDNFGLSGWVTNALGLAAFWAAGQEFFSGDEEARLLSGAHLLVFITWIVLLQRKSPRQYWFLCALSVLQIAVGSVLTQQGWYGAMLLCALSLLVWTLTSFSLFRAALPFMREERTGQTKSFRRRSALASVVPGKTEGSKSAEQADAVAVVQPSAADFFSRPAQIHDAIHHDRRVGFINGRLVFATMATVCGSLILAGVVFAFTPRIWLSNRPFGDISPTEAIRTVTGFSDEVRLGDMGEILESSKPVFDFRVFDHDSGLPVSLLDFFKSLNGREPYFRGMSMHEYSDGEWISGLQAGGRSPIRYRPEINKKKGLIRQEYVLHSAGDRYLFVMHPYETVGYVNREGSAMRWNLTSTLVAPQVSPKQPLKYFVLVQPTKDSVTQFAPRPVFERTVRWEIGSRFYLQLPDSGLERLQALAYEVAKIDPAEKRREQRLAQYGKRTPGTIPTYEGEMEIAKRLNDYLKNSDEYSYSLDTSLQDPSIDPVEDFLFNRKSGHCTYYATALVLMLRSVGIPARLVNGFLGGHENSLTGTLEVQERHAHAWVEAQIKGRWVLFDPTSSNERAATLQDAEPTFPVLRDVSMSFREFWSTLVVNASFAQQQRRIYKPVLNAAESWFEQAKTTYEERGLQGLLLNPRQWFSIQGGVVAFFAMLFIALLFRLGFWRWLASLFGRRNQSDDAVAANRKIVEFYERFRHACEAHRVVRAPQQTQREFAETVSHQFADRLRAKDLLAFPGEIAELFYCVRFGEQMLSADKLADLSRGMTDFEACLQADG